MPTTFDLKVRVIDAVMDEELGDSLPNHRLGCFVQYNDKFVDAIMIQQGQVVKPDTLTIHLDDVPGVPDPKVVFICKDIEQDEPYAGSVSIFRSILLEGQPNHIYT